MARLASCDKGQVPENLPFPPEFADFDLNNAFRGCRFSKEPHYKAEWGMGN